MQALSSIVYKFLFETSLSAKQMSDAYILNHRIENTSAFWYPTKSASNRKKLDLASIEKAMLDIKNVLRTWAVCFLPAFCIKPSIRQWETCNVYFVFQLL